jgi:hypothetical protein
MKSIKKLKKMWKDAKLAWKVMRLFKKLKMWK